MYFPQLRLAILIPAYNEEKTIGEVLRSMPKELQFISEIKTVVVNDGSKDRTVEIAKENGADYIVDQGSNKGLARAINTGLIKCLEIGADIILTVDADNQYESSEIPLMLRPILDGKADLVLGDRQIDKLDHMPPQKKTGNKIASGVVSLVCKQKIRDAQTGFRALTRECALRINIFSDYTYTQEMILQAVNNKMKIVEVPITFKKRHDHSRLIKNIFSYAYKVFFTMMRTLTFYMPAKTYGILAGIVLFVGAVLVSRPLIHYVSTGSISPFIPSMIAAAIFFIVGVQTVVFAIMSGMNQNNNRALTEILYLIKKQSINQEVDVKRFIENILDKRK